MPEIHNTTFDIRILFIALLAGVLLVAPCKVRNSLEHALGLEKSEVSNKLKTTVSSNACASYEAVQMENSAANELGISTLVSPTVVTDALFTTSNSDETGYTEQKQHLASVVPLYILYRQFKIYS